MKNGVKKIEQEEKLRCYLKYSGPDVESGTIDVKNLAPALLAFNNSINKIYRHVTDNSANHCNTYVKVLSKGSFNIDLDVVGSVLITASQSGTISAIKIAYETLIKQIFLKKFLKGKPPTHVQPIYGNKVEIENIDNSKVTINAQTYNIYVNKLVDNDLKDLTEPLGAGIETVTLGNREGGGNIN